MSQLRARRRRHRLVDGGSGAYLTYLADFDQASAAAIDPAVVRLTPVKHWSSTWAWWAVRHPDLSTQPAFAIAKADHYNAAANMWLACWAAAADTDTWHQLTVTIGATDLTFSPAAPFPGGPVYLAALPLFPFARVQRLVGEWAANALVGETASSTNKVVYTTTSRDAGDGSGRTVPALPLYGLRVANATANTKNVAIFTALNHPSELGGWILEGAMTWLLTTGVKQKMLLDWCNVLVYPCLNPQGVWAGYFRSCPQSPTDDHNRKYNDGTSGVLEEVDALKTAIAADAADVDAFFDLHSYMSASAAFANCIDAADPAHVAYKNKVNTYDASFSLSTSAVTDGLKDWIAATFAPTLVMAPEHGHIATKGVADWKTYGSNMMQALADYLIEGRLPHGPGVGCRVFNGTTDRIDWASIYNPSGAAMSVSFWLKIASLPAHNSYIWMTHRSGDAAVQCLIYLQTDGTFGIQRSGTTNLTMFTVTALGTGAWHNITITHDGTFNNKLTVYMYVDGTEDRYATSGGNGSGEFTDTGTWSLGGRKYDDTRNYPGSLAQFGVWNRVLTSGEIANLTARQAPNLAASSGLQFYFKGNTADLHDSATNTLGSADGTTQLTGVGNGPVTIYP